MIRVLFVMVLVFIGAMTTLAFFATLLSSVDGLIALGFILTAGYVVRRNLKERHAPHRPS